MGDAIPVSVEFSRSRRTTCVGTLTAAATASRWHRVDGVSGDHVDSRGITTTASGRRGPATTPSPRPGALTIMKTASRWHRVEGVTAVWHRLDAIDATTAEWHRFDAIDATPASSSSFTTRSRGPVDRLVPVEGDDRSTLVAVDPPAKVDVVAERAAPIFFRISGRMRRVRPFLREQRPQSPSSPVPLRVLLFDLRLRNPEFDRGADVLGNCGLVDV